jgi:hypothetical protein
VNDDHHQMAAECGVPISSERVMHHLRCLSVDCEWQAFEVEQYIKQLERDRDVLAAEVEANRLVTAMAAKHENNGQRWNLACKARRLAVDATDKSGALTRAKEAK